MISVINTVKIEPWEMGLIKSNARKAEIGGMSHVRKGDDRALNLEDDQVIGQIGNLALSLYFTGDNRLYKIARYVANRNPLVGDHGEDLIGSNLDVKASLMRRSQDPMTYHLLVRPWERHEDWTYILALVEPVVDGATDVHLVGWASDNMLPDEPSMDNRFKGAYCMKATDLVPLPPVMWKS